MDVADARAQLRDDSTFRLLEAIFASSQRYTIAGSFETARAAMAGLPPRGADLAVVDVQLPGHSGIEAVKRLRARWPHTRCVMLTNSEEEADLFAALEAG